MQGTCGVCYLAKSDVTPKAVNFCVACGEWICSECEGNLWLRAVAMTKKRLGIGRTKKNPKPSQ
jgi:hypothetical protein